MLNRVLKAARKADKRVRKDKYFRQGQNIEDRSRCRDPRFCPAALPQARQDRRLCGLFFDTADEPLLKMRTRPFIFSGLSEECGRVADRGVMTRPVGGYRTGRAGLTSTMLESKGDRPGR
jgi:hypothetical protein